VTVPLPKPRVPTMCSPLQVQVLWGECISGALYLGDFKSMAKAVGFADPRILTAAPIAINDASMKRVLGSTTKFHSITARLFKLPGMLEPDCEDYGQVAVYKVCP
jgi:arsenite methyltransferase